MDKKLIDNELNRLTALLEKANIPSQTREVLQPVMENMAWQKVKLDETREEIKDAGVVCEYNNGGGQQGIRENPIFKGYINLYKAYMTGLEKFTSYLPKDVVEELNKDAETALDKVLNMKKGA